MPNPVFIIAMEKTEGASVGERHYVTCNGSTQGFSKTLGDGQPFLSEEEAQNFAKEVKDNLGLRANYFVLNLWDEKARLDKLQEAKQ